ncbi:MAG: uroporphyrinogen decarboxylase [Hydrogenophilales bacterium]
MIINSKLQDALKKIPQSIPPVWLMRQAGRYLPEYQKVRSKAGSFLNLCKNPDFACEVALQPIQRFDLDAAILFSDILTIPDALGLELEFSDGEGPVFKKPVRSSLDIRNLRILNIEDDLHYVFQAVKKIKQELKGKIPLIGFSGSPFTLAMYMIEGRGRSEFMYAKSFLYSNTPESKDLLQILTENIINYLDFQVKYGADVLMLFDTWSGILSSDWFEEFSFQFNQQIANIIKSRHPNIPIVIYAKNCNSHLDHIKNYKFDCVSVDWTFDLKKLKKQFENKFCIQGNLDPTFLLSSNKILKEEINKIKNIMKDYPGFIFNLGHGISKDTDPSKVSYMVDIIRDLS